MTDGTVVCTGATVAWAFRGFNPHHRKDRSYYPLLAHVAQTGHILRVKNRPGNVHDSKQSAALLRGLIDGVRRRLGRRLPLEFRMDAAFFQPDVLRLLAARGCAYAIKVGYWSWLPLKQLAAERRHWHALAPGVTGFEHHLVIPQWNLRLRVMIYRKHVQHESPKNFQLDLFTPDDGHFEYYAVATNLPLSLPALYAFIGGRGAQEKTIAELKGEFALDVVPTRHYGANCAWQQLSILAYNVARSFQLDTIADPATSLPQTHVRVCPAQHADAALLADHPGRPADPPRRPQRPPPRTEPGDRGPLRPHSTRARGLSYFRIGVSSGRAVGRGPYDMSPPASTFSLRWNTVASRAWCASDVIRRRSLRNRGSARTTTPATRSRAIAANPASSLSAHGSSKRDSGSMTPPPLTTRSNCA